jgi:cell wall assembly regulator SMI1
MSKNAPDLAKLPAALKRLDAWFALHRPRYFKGLHPGAKPAELAGLPAELGVLLGWHNGQSEDFVGCFEEHWFLMSATEVRAADVGITGWLPFLDDDAGNYLCLDTTQKPPTVRSCDLDEPEGEVVAPSLTDWIVAFADNVEAGHYVEDSERGTLMRKHS